MAGVGVILVHHVKSSIVHAEPHQPVRLRRLNDRRCSLGLREPDDFVLEYCSNLRPVHLRRPIRVMTNRPGARCDFYTVKSHPPCARVFRAWNKLSRGTLVRCGTRPGRRLKISLELSPLFRTSRSQVGHFPVVRAEDLLDIPLSDRICVGFGSIDLVI